MQVSSKEIAAALSKTRYKQRYGIISTVKQQIGSFFHPLINILSAQDYDGYPRLGEADSRGVVVGSRISGDPLIWTGDVTGAGSATSVSIRPAAGEYWEIDAISVEHDDIAARAVWLTVTDGTDEVFLIPENVRDVTNAVETPIFPIIYNTGDYNDIISQRPYLISYDTYMKVHIATLTATKVLDVNVAYRKVKY